MEGKDKISQAHLDALPILLQPLIRAKSQCKDIPWQEVVGILCKWDKDREVKSNG